MKNIRSWRKGLQAALAVLVVALVAQLASASGLDINGAKVNYAGTFNSCSRNALTVTNVSTTQASVSGLDATNCSGKTVTLRLGDGTSVLNATDTTVSASMTTVTLPTYTPSAIDGAIVYVGGWPMPTTWSYTPPVVLPLVSCEPVNGGGRSCSVAETTGTSWTVNGETFWIKTFRISTTSSSAVPWQVTINLSSSSLPAFSNHLQDLQGGLVLVSTSGCSATPRTVTVKGTTTWGNYNTVTNGRTSEFQVLGSNTGGSNLINC